MPNWGLTTEQRNTKPWGLDPDLLEPSKTITDPVHDDIYLNKLEVLILDSAPMQRLGRVKQLGTTHRVYLGATHTRLAHSAGTLRAAQDLLDAVWNSRTHPQAEHVLGNLLDEWANQNALEEEFARATVLARLGGLLHDLCHIPMGHTIEDDLRILTPHDENAERFQLLWDQINPDARKAIEAADGLFAELRTLIISKDEHAKSFQSNYPFVGDIVGNTICADLIDYLRRDHHNTGLPLALGHRFVDSFFVVGSDHPYYPKRMVVTIERKGRRRVDVVSELVKYLRYRYELTERVLTHHAKTSADAMLGKMLELWYDDVCEKLQRSASPVVATEGKLIELAKPARTRKSVAPVVTEEVAAEARARLELQFLRRSDDGLLEYILDQGEGEAASSRQKAAAELANGLRERRLFKILGRAGSDKDLAMAQETFDKFAADPRIRRELERDAATFASVAAGWHIVVWLPNPKMRLKVADVLVHQTGTYVTPLSKIEPTSREIVEQHQRLWAVTVYAPEEVRVDSEKCDAILSYLGDRMGMRFIRPDGSEVLTVAELELDSAVRRLNPGDDTLHDQLADLAQQVAATQPENATFSDIVDALVAAAVTNNLVHKTT